MRFQAVKTWKTSTDPEFAAKVRWIRELTDRDHNPPIVVAADEMGPTRSDPTAAARGRPRGIGTEFATKKRTHGVRHLMGMYDYYHHTLRGYLSARKTGKDWMKFLPYVRSAYTQRRPIFLIQDNLSGHTTPEVLREADRLWIRFAPIPTNVSHYNQIETRFRSIREIALTETDYRNWRELVGAIQGATRELNRKHSGRAQNVRRRLLVRHEDRGPSPIVRSSAPTRSALHPS